MYLPALSKARKQAEGVAVNEGLYQNVIANAADGYTSTSPTEANSAALRAEARNVFHTKLGTTQMDVYVTNLMWSAKNEAEFRAYWNTLINPNNTNIIEFRNGALVAEDESGTEYLLLRIDAIDGTYPVSWEFLSSSTSENTSGTLGTNVVYSDGHIVYVPYPSEYPACRTVAELSHRFLAESS
jgi:hypothetical protein